MFNCGFHISRYWKIKRINDKRKLWVLRRMVHPHDILGEQIVGDFIGDLFEIEFC